MPLFISASRSGPRWTHAPSTRAKTRAWPACHPAPWLPVAPRTTTAPSRDMATPPMVSPAASPSIRAPSRVHAPSSAPPVGAALADGAAVVGAGDGAGAVGAGVGAGAAVGASVSPHSLDETHASPAQTQQSFFLHLRSLVRPGQSSGDDEKQPFFLE